MHTFPFSYTKFKHGKHRFYREPLLQNGKQSLRFIHNCHIFILIQRPKHPLSKQRVRSVLFLRVAEQLQSGYNAHHEASLNR